MKALGGEYDYRVEEHESLKNLLLGRTERTKDELTRFVRWKSTRTATRFAENSEAAVLAVTRAALAVEERMLAVKLLLCLEGVGVSIASTILAFVKPTVHAVIDQHTLRALGVEDVGPAQLRVSHYDKYLRFLEVSCGELTLRELEQGLFMYSRSSR